MKILVDNLVPAVAAPGQVNRANDVNGEGRLTLTMLAIISRIQAFFK